MSRERGPMERWPHNLPRRQPLIGPGGKAIALFVGGFLIGWFLLMMLWV